MEIIARMLLAEGNQPSVVCWAAVSGPVLVHRRQAKVMITA